MLKRLWYWHAIHRTWRRTEWTSDMDSVPPDAECREHETPHWISEGTTPAAIEDPGPTLEEYCRG